MPLLSVITPCYNLGKYLRENIENVKRLPEGLYEHIIVDDRSTQQETIDIIEQLQGGVGPTIIRHEVNQELANTINTGVARSSGKYIFVLSADDLLVPEVVVKAVELLEQDQHYDIVYGDRIKFEGEEGLESSRPFNMQYLLIDNYIHAAAVYRREVWEANGGYDANAPYMGMEDWEFWLHAVKNGFRFYYLPEPTAYYRILPNSKIRQLTAQRARVNELMEYIFNKHSDLVGAHLLDNFIINRIRKGKLGYLYKWILKAYFPKKFDKMCKEGKFRRYL